MSLGPAEIGLVLLAVMLLFGYKKLPDASRSLGRSLRIFKGEVDGLRDDPGTPSPTPEQAPSAPSSTSAPTSQAHQQVSPSQPGQRAIDEPLTGPTDTQAPSGRGGPGD